MNGLPDDSEFFRQAEALRTAMDSIRRAHKVLYRSRVPEVARMSDKRLARAGVLASARMAQEVRYRSSVLEAAREKTRGRRRRLGEVGQVTTYLLRRVASRRTVRRPVGSSLRGLAEFLVSKKSFEQIYEPLVSDMRLEYCEALAANRWWKARWVWVRGNWSFLTAAFAHFCASGVRHVVRAWRFFHAGG